MGDGEAREFGRGKELMEIEGGVFKGMVEESGEREELVRAMNRVEEDGR